MNFDNLLKALSPLADQLAAPSFSKKMTAAYVQDTGYLQRYVIDREVNAPLALIKHMEATTGGCVACAFKKIGRKVPVGKVGVLLPDKEINLSMVRLLFASLLTGSQLIIKLPGRVNHAAGYFRKLISEHIPGVAFSPDNQTAEAFLDNCILSAEIKTIVVYHDDKWIYPYKNAVRRYNKKLIFGGPAKNPQIVLQNADLDKAVTTAVQQGLMNGGQSGLATERFFVHAAVANEFIERLTERTSLIKAGHAQEDDTILGPVNDEAVLNRLIAQVIDAKHKGASILTGGKPVELGRSGLYIFPPTIVTGCTTDMQMIQQPSTGPLFPVITFNTEEELLTKIDHTDYGFLATIYGTPSVLLTEYLYRNHHTVCFDQTAAINEKASCQLSDGGSRQSGFVWEWTNNHFIQRDGSRILMEELAGDHSGRAHCKRSSL